MSVRREFLPYAVRCVKGDSLTVYWKELPDYSEKINDRITIYRSLDTEEVVGVRINGLSDVEVER